MAKSGKLRFLFNKKRRTIIAEVRDLWGAVGRSARFTISAEAKVHDSRAINDDFELFRRDFVIDQAVHRIQIPLHSLNAFTYSGEMIDIRLHGKLVIDDALIFDTTIEQEIALRLTQKPAVDNDAAELIEPKDTFNFISNLMAIPYHAKGIVLALLVVAGVVIAANTLIGVHDQLVPASATYFYSHRNSDGESSSPLLKSLLLSGPAGAAVWVAIRGQLRRYMRFKLKPLPPHVRRKQRLLVSDLIAGSSRVDLEDITLRIVACNLEKGQYQRGSGTNRRTVSFSEPVRGVLLYSKHVDRIPCGEPVCRYFEDAFTFDPMFSALYPPWMISETHGVDVYWEVQLIHHEFIDQELPGPTDMFRYRDFLKGKEAS